MNYGEIKKTDIANGNGVRVSLFVSGCRNACPGCFQPETWDFSYGKPFTAETVSEIFQALRPSYIQGLTVLGGEPFEPENQRDLLPLLKKIRRELPSKDIWMYTGYLLDQDLLDGGRKHIEVTDELLSMVDVLVDGRFVEELKDITLPFCGSSNQRLIDVPASLKECEVVLFDPTYLKF